MESNEEWYCVACGQPYPTAKTFPCKVCTVSARTSKAPTAFTTSRESRDVQVSDPETGDVYGPGVIVHYDGAVEYLQPLEERVRNLFEADQDDDLSGNGSVL